MALSRIWNARLQRWRGHARTAAAVAVCAAALFGAAAGCKVFLAPDRPDIASIAQRVGNQGDQVGAFASDFVVTWLTATTAERAALQRFISLPDTALSLPTTPAAVVTAPQVVSVIHTGTAGDTDVYTATVSVTERPYASAQSTRSFYRVPVSMWNYQPRALTLPARINGPGPGADFRTAYPQALSADSPVFTLVRGFLTTYLTRQHTLWHKLILQFRGERGDSGSGRGGEGVAKHRQPALGLLGGGFVLDDIPVFSE